MSKAEPAFHNYFTLDTNTGAITDLGLDGPGLGASDPVFADDHQRGQHASLFNNLETFLASDTATGTLFSASTGQGCSYGRL